MNVEVYDFRRPGRLTAEVEQRIAAWLRAALALLPAKLAKQMVMPVDMSLETVLTASPTQAISQLPEALVCHCLDLGAGPIRSLAAFPRNLSLALLAGVMGDSPTECPPDRALTPVEESLWTFLLQQIVQLIQESWPGEESLPIAIGSAVPQPKRSKILPPDATVLVLTFITRGPFGQSHWEWLIPQQELMNRLTQLSTDLKRPGARSSIEHAIGEMPVEVSVQLGATELPVSQLARLRAGDLVILDQRVSEPLEARIAGQPRFHGWPGRVGPRRAFQIDSLVDC